MTKIAEQIVELRGRGVSSADIAHRLGVAQSTVHYHLRKLGEWPEPAKRLSTSKPKSDARSRVETRARVAELLALGVRRIEIARRLGLSKSTVSYHARRLGETIDERCCNRYDWSVIQEFYDEGHSLRESMKAFGFSSGAWHEAVKRGAIVPRPGYQPVEKIFARDTRRDRGHLKSRLLQLGVKDGRCEACGISEWLGAPIALALHHVNGERNDNRIENLQLLCPNCHSQTDTFGGRKPRRSDAEAA